jgi:hypothetical protein
MRLIIMALLLVLVFGTAQAAPLQGSDANATVTLFGSSRTPLEDENATDEILKVDVGLMGTENATYQLMDNHNNIYTPIYKPLTSGKQIIYFLAPIDSLFKLINVTPQGEKPISINWWTTPKGGNDKLIVRYYGIVDWVFNPDEQMIVVQVRVQNNGTENLTVSPENFTLLDQWGWPYLPTLGFDAENVGPQNATSDRVKLGFTGVSLVSRPAALAYDYGTSNQIVIMFERDYVPLSNEQVYGSNVTKSAASVQSLPAAALPALNSTAQSETGTALAKNETAAAKKSSIKDSLAASKARLAAMKEGLDSKTPESPANSTTNETTNGTSSISTKA